MPWAPNSIVSSATGQSGRYNSKSEVIREGLRLLEQREQSRAVQLDELRKAFAGIERGAIPAKRCSRTEGKIHQDGKDRGM